jgi:hypothetical protein
MPTARGVVTITDITDGLPTISIIQSNENHTFPATSAGVVSATDRNNFTNDILVLVGADQAAYVTITPTANNTYTVGTPTVTPAAGVTPVFTSASVTEIDGAGAINIARMTISAMNDTTTVQSVRVSVPVIVRRLNQNVTINVEVTFSKAVGGSASSLTINGTRQNFLFNDYTSSAPIADNTINGDITLTAAYDGPASGNISWFQSTNGGAESALTPTVAGATTSTHTVTRAAFGNASYITYRVAKGGVVDRMSVVRIDRGEASYIVVPRVTSGSLQLKNNSGSVTVTVDLFQGSAEVSDYTGWTFQWFNGATAIAGPTTTPPAGVTEVDPTVCRTVTIDASYVPDNGSITLNVVATKP